MKITTNIQVLFFGVLLYGSCSKPCKPHAALSMIVDTSYQDLGMACFLSNKEDTFMESSRHFCDTTMQYNWDSIPSGEYLFTLSTIYGQKQEVPVSVCDDNVIRLSGGFGFKSTDLITKEELKHADTIRFVFASKGCFHYTIERYLLTKESGGRYHLSACSEGDSDKNLDIDKFVSAGIIDTLHKVQIDSKASSGKALKGSVGCWSTTTISFYLLAENKVFSVNDQGICDWKVYESVRKVLAD